MTTLEVIESTIRNQREKSQAAEEAAAGNRDISEILKSSDEWMRFVVATYKLTAASVPEEPPPTLPKWFAALQMAFMLGWESCREAEKKLVV